MLWKSKTLEDGRILYWCNSICTDGHHHQPTIWLHDDGSCHYSDRSRGSQNLHLMPPQSIDANVEMIDRGLQHDGQDSLEAVVVRRGIA